MANYFITNVYTDDNDGAINGGSANDRLTYSYTIPGTGVSTGYFSGDLASGYSGLFDGSGGNNAWYTGMQHFTFLTSVTGNDNIRSGDGNDSLMSGGGDDTLNSGGGDDTVDGGSGNDYWIANRSADSSVNVNLNGVSALTGGGSVRNMEGFNLTTGAGNDVITGHQSSVYADRVYAGDGNDRIILWTGSTDEAHGQGGSDRLVVQNQTGATSVGYWSGNLADGYNGLYDGPGGDNIWFYGIEHFTYRDLVGENDNITTGHGNDSLLGAGGDDTLNSGGGHDTVDGGDGRDYWIADRSADSMVNVNLNEVSTLTGGGSVRNMEGFNLTTGAGDDLITGHQNGGYADTVYSGDGDDLITMWMGDGDEAHGQGGTDRLVLTNEIGAVSVGYWSGDLANGYNGLFDGPSGNNTWFYGIEHFTYTDLAGGNDNVTTGHGNDSILAGVGDDTVNSGGGDDTIDGQSGTDYWIANLSGHALVDVNLNGVSDFEGNGSVRNMEGLNLTTGAGNDIITGHRDSNFADRVYSGAGDDLITMWMGSDDEAHGGAGQDRLVLINERGATSVGYWSAGETDGYSGLFDGPDGNNTWFYDINHFDYTDRAGGNDNITTGDGDDKIVAGAGNDTVNSGGGDDSVYGGTGLDYWIANRSADAMVNVDLNQVSTLTGGGSVRAMEGFNLTTGAGDDLITGHRNSVFADRVYAGDGNDIITMWTGATDEVHGQGGSDRMILTNQHGATSVGYWAGNATDGYSGLYDGPGDANTWFYGIEHFSYTDEVGENDNITTGAGDDSLLSGGGDDRVNSGGGHDTVDGGAGNDFWIANRSADALVDVNLNETSDLTGGGSVMNMEGFNLTTGAGNDSITGHQSSVFADRVYAGDGDDLITMWMGETDEVRGQGGTDRLVLTNGQGAISTGYWSGNATDGYNGLFDGPGGNNTWFYGIEHFTYLDMAGGNDNIRTGDGDDSISAGGGDDNITSGAGNDTVDGGAGEDRMHFGIHSSAVSSVSMDDAFFYINSSAGRDTVARNVEYYVFNDQTLSDAQMAALAGQAPTGAVVVTGTPTQGETLTADTSTVADANGLGPFSYQWLRDGVAIPGATDATYVLGQDDVDSAISVRVSYTDGIGTQEALTSAATDPVEGSGLHLVGTQNADFLDGGAGDDTIEGLAGNDRLRGFDGDDSLLGGDGADTIVGGDGNDQIIGGTSDNDLRDVVYGGVGNDSISGGHGNDELRGDAGNDTIEGGVGADTVIGGAGDDVLTGSGWSDLIFGGDGDDFVNGGWGHDRVNGGADADRFFHIGYQSHGSDWIQDYDAAEGDLLNFGIGSATASQFQINTAHTTSPSGERSGDDTIEEAFIIYRPTGQIMWALVDGAGQDSINLLIAGEVYDLMA
ncbi:calcium-binding protein [Shimia sp. SDUM112013]|uniref:beta strand repeat-containing protein n=1 Tax=Shimia sp. SDUM112013 TaxID=3136160 RepID=UPI0032EBD6F8